MTQKYVYWQDDGMWRGYLEEYPDYWTQAETEDELKENLLDLCKNLSSDVSEHIRYIGELTVA